MPCQPRRKRLTKAIALIAFPLCLSGLLGTWDAVPKDDDIRTENVLDRIESEVRAAEAVRAVKRLQHTYSHYLDMGLWSELADLFTDNAVGQFPSGTVTGKGNIKRHFMEEADCGSPGIPEGLLNSHLILQPIVTLGNDGKTAWGTWHEFALLGKFGASASWMGGVYENEYVLEDRVWKISRVRYYKQYSGQYDEWGLKAPPRWDIPYHFEAAHVGVTIPESALASLTPDSPREPAAVRLTLLSHRLQRLNDETAVRNLQHSYGYYMDRKLWDDVADLFAKDGLLELAQRGVYAGKARIRRALEVFYGASPLRNGELFDHINLATVVTIAPDGRKAGARSTQLGMLGVNGEYAQWELGTYENEFIKQDGVWRIKAIHYYPRMATDYYKGWGKDAKPVPAPNAEFPPDRSPTDAFEAYPKIHYVAFHYANPVTGLPVQYPQGALTKVQIIKESRNDGVTPASTGNPDIEAAVKELRHQLDEASGVDAVENLNSSYGYYLDESAWDQMADTFASNGSKEISGVGVYVGRDRIRKVLNLRGPRGGRTPNFFTIHQLTQPVIHISDDGSSAKARLRLFQCGGNSDGTSGSWIGGIYENTAVKENGEWKFGVQDLHHMYNVSYRNGWAKVDAASGGTPGRGMQQGLGGAAPRSRFAAEFPPDRPIRAKQYAFPEIVEPAFHYRNPVTGRMPSELLQ